MFSEERKREILQILKELEKVSVSSLAEQFNVSEATIRRDLDDLARKELIVRTHGGALSKNDFEMVSINERKHEHLKEKKVIANEALKLIKNGDNIFLSGGSTVSQLVKLLGEFEDLTVVTNSIDFSCELSRFPNIEVTVLGGTIWKKNLFTLGPIAIKYLNEYHIDKLFFSVPGIDLEVDLTSPSILVANVINKVISISKRRYLLADSSKFGKIFLNKVAPITCADLLITDDKLDDVTKTEIGKMGVEVRIAKPEDQ